MQKEEKRGGKPPWVGAHKATQKDGRGEGGVCSLPASDAFTIFLPRIVVLTLLPTLASA